MELDMRKMRILQAIIDDYILTATLCFRAQVGSVTEHIAERYASVDLLNARAILKALNLAAASVQIAYNVAHILLRYNNRNLHNRLKEYRVC